MVSEEEVGVTPKLSLRHSFTLSFSIPREAMIL